MQIRWRIGCTSAEYVTGELWNQATLTQCPIHPDGGCGFRRHSSYPRVRPKGAWVARYYCRVAHQTFSMLPDCLASHLSSTLADVEQVARMALEVGVPKAAEQLRPDVGMQGGERWVRRRLYPVLAMLVTLQGIYPEALGSCRPHEVGSYSLVLGTVNVLPALRRFAEPQLRSLPKPVGFRQGSVTRKPP